MADEGVQVSTSALVQKWRALGGESLLILFKTPQDHAQAMAALQRAIEAVDRSLDTRGPDGAPQIGPSLPEASPRGPVVYLSFCDSASILKRWVTAIAGELEAQGSSGRLTAVLPEYTGYERPLRLVDCITVGLVLPTNETVVYRPDGTMNAWPVDEDVTTQLVDEVVEFCLRGTGETFFAHGMSQFRIDPADAPRLVSQAIGRGPPVSLTWLGTDDVVRSAQLDYNGRAHFEWRDESLPGTDLAEDLSQILVKHADRLEYGLVRQSWLLAAGWDDVVNRRPPRLPGDIYYRRTPHLERTLVPDAYGIQLLTRAHLDRQPDLSDWRVEEVAPGRYLVTAKQLNAWFGPREPNDATLEKARHEFGSLIIDEEDHKRALAEAQARCGWFISRSVGRRGQDGGMYWDYEYHRRDGTWTSDRVDAESFPHEQPPMDLVIELRKKIDEGIKALWLPLTSGDVAPMPPPEPREDV